ncbi:MAG: Abi family protein [Pseudomonadota bacterium]
MYAYLTAPRSTAVQQFFQTRNPRDLMGAYSWCQAVGAALLPIMGDLEVALRNSLHSALSHYFGQQSSYSWMLGTPATKPSAKPAPAPHKLNSQAQQDVQKVVDRYQRKRKRAATPDDVVAALSFGFWEQIINALTHKAHPAGLKESIMKAAFPYAPDTQIIAYSDNAFVNRVVALLAQIRDVRNRIGHHDSLWACPEFSEHGKTGFFPRRPRHTVRSLQQLAERISWLAGWIDPDIRQHIHASDHWANLQVLLSRESLRIYRMTGGSAETSRLIWCTQQPTQPKREKKHRQPLHARHLYAMHQPFF